MANVKYYSSSSRNQYRLVFRRYPCWISAGALMVLTNVFHSFLHLFWALPMWCLRLGHNVLPVHSFQLIIRTSSWHLILCSLNCWHYCLISHKQILVLQFFTSHVNWSSFTLCSWVVSCAQDMEQQALPTKNNTYALN